MFVMSAFFSSSCIFFLRIFFAIISTCRCLALAIHSESHVCRAKQQNVRYKQLFQCVNAKYIVSITITIYIFQIILLFTSFQLFYVCIAYSKYRLLEWMRRHRLKIYFVGIAFEFRKQMVLNAPLQHCTASNKQNNLRTGEWYYCTELLLYNMSSTGQ